VGRRVGPDGAEAEAQSEYSEQEEEGMNLVLSCVSRQARARAEGAAACRLTELARAARLRYDLEQVGACAQRRAMSGSRVVAAKAVKSRQEPTLGNADRTTTSTGKWQGWLPCRKAWRISARVFGSDSWLVLELSSVEASSSCHSHKLSLISHKSQFVSHSTTETLRQPCFTGKEPPQLLPSR
jgi:hypothetical protein